MDEITIEFGVHKTEQIEHILSVLLSTRERYPVTRDQRYWWEGDGKKAIDLCYELISDPKDTYEN